MVGHGNNGFGSAQAAFQTAIFCPGRRLAVSQTVQAKPQRVGSSIVHFACRTTRHFVPADGVLRAESEKGTELLLRVHWIFDKTEAIARGRRVAGYVFANAFLPGAQKESGREIILGASRCYIGGHRMALPYLF